MDKKTERKNEIIGDSINLMYLNGYNGTSVKDITVIAGIPKGSFYNYFEDKEHYALDAIHYYYKVMVRDKFLILEDQNLTPLKRVKEFYNYSVLKLEERELKMGCFVGNLTQEMAETSELISDTAADFYNHLVELIYLNLTEAVETNELNFKGDLNILSGFIVSSWQGTLLRLKITKNRDLLNDFLYMLNDILLK